MARIVIDYIKAKSKIITKKLLRTPKSDGQLPSADPKVLQECVEKLLRGKDG